MNMAYVRCLTFPWFLLLQSVMIYVLCHNEMTRKSYMIGFMENEIINVHYSSYNLSLHIVNTGKNTTRVYYQTNDTQLSDISLPGRTTQIVPFPEKYMVRESGKTQKGIRVESDDEVIIYGVNRFKIFSKSSMDGFLCIPVTYADTRFYVTLSKLSPILLVGTVHGTSVNVTLRTNCTIKLNSKSYRDGEVIKTTLDEYETLQLQCRQGCLTGTFINASHPVSVFSGNKRQTQIPITNGFGHLVEQIPSVNSWGMYFFTSIPPAYGSYTCKIVAADPSTTINFTCSDNTSESILLTGNKFHQINVELQTICILTANKPVLVTLFIRTLMLDRFMILIPPVHEFINSVLHFYVPNSLNFWLVFVTDANVVNIDGKQFNLTAVDNIPCFFKGTLSIRSGIHNISLPNHTSSITGYIHGRDGFQAMSYPLLQHKQDSRDNLATNFPQGPCERHATAGTSTVNFPIETTSSTMEKVTTPPETSVSVTKTTSSQELPPETSVSVARTTSSQELPPETTVSVARTTSSQELPPETTVSVARTTSSLELPPETSVSVARTTSSQELPPGTSVYVARTTSSQESTSIYKAVKTDTLEMVTSPVGMTTLSRAFEKITTSPIRNLTVSSAKMCRCLRHNCSLNPNAEEMKQIVEALRTELLIPPEKTNRYKRSLTSVWDERTSAQVLGYGASIILAAVGIGIVLLDLNNLIVMAKRIRHNLLSRSCQK